MLTACLIRIFLVSKGKYSLKNSWCSDVSMAKKIRSEISIISFQIYILMTCGFFPSQRKHFLISLTILKWLLKLNFASAQNMYQGKSILSLCLTSPKQHRAGKYWATWCNYRKGWSMYYMNLEKNMRYILVCAFLAAVVIKLPFLFIMHSWID